MIKDRRAFEGHFFLAAKSKKICTIGGVTIKLEKYIVDDGMAVLAIKDEEVIYVIVPVSPSDLTYKEDNWDASWLAQASSIDLSFLDPVASHTIWKFLRAKRKNKTFKEDCLRRSQFCDWTESILDVQQARCGKRVSLVCAQQNKSDPVVSLIPQTFPESRTSTERLDPGLFHVRQKKEKKEEDLRAIAPTGSMHWQ